jgi:hypothetical protein
MRKTCFVAFVLVALLVFALPSASSAQVSVGLAVHIGPPALPVYAQPICPGPGYAWTPGYWAYGADGYYWVPGTWVVAPVGLLWTPGYWGWGSGVYAWHAGYWGPHVGFYGGINYGFGYGGVGFVGGRWDHGAFMYNTAVMHVDERMIHTTYVDRTVIVRNENHVSFNGGAGGVMMRPTAEERIAEREHHTPAMEMQMQHEHMASMHRENFASENHGRPAMAATARPGEFSHGANTSFHPPEHVDAHPDAHAQMNDHHADAHPQANDHHDAHVNNTPHNNPHPEEKPKNEQHNNDKHDR